MNRVVVALATVLSLTACGSATVPVPSATSSSTAFSDVHSLVSTAECGVTGAHATDWATVGADAVPDCSWVTVPATVSVHTAIAGGMTMAMQQVASDYLQTTGLDNWAESTGQPAFFWQHFAASPFDAKVTEVLEAGGHIRFDLRGTCLWPDDIEVVQRHGGYGLLVTATPTVNCVGIGVVAGHPDSTVFTAAAHTTFVSYVSGDERDDPALGHYLYESVAFSCADITAPPEAVAACAAG